ncbi:ABC transporter ATP-binding protein [Leptospira licerasiae]|uniref:ABC transporter, ATP-binding protein n=1 Tax=Leptospira licerasiae str. MMD4847 TaxID=1049971 RepID=A0ABN0H6X6_9LEPT|nr:ABC transporter ATP-binding protein [Leptospira licerasiae]EIE00682.1 ABC transporter, ATP-binding protein [Leptospira licerasiae serovar Varillal str. VAR 010]EJZ41272.1 ABC transporter, ATP-binding protein [Leptospira licerasiae str. MMD4847]
MIKIENISKTYQGYSKPWNRLLSALTFGYFGLDVKYKALDGISFSAEKGEVIGIIGRNGAGKSTLLKLLTGVSKEDAGKLEKKGTVRSILELGVGFNPELSGEENLYYNGLVWGLDPEELIQSSEEIFSFSGLSEFRKSPLKNYSSGMTMRLGFALATAKRPDILIVDEALAVGDASFQQKSLNRFRKFSEEGTLTLIVSHDLELLKSVCTRLLVLEKGKLVFDGDPINGFREYMQIIASSSLEGNTKIQDKDSLVESLDVEIEYGGKSNPSILPVGAEVLLRVAASFRSSLEDLTVGFHIDDHRGIRVFGTNTFHIGGRQKDLKPKEPVRIDFRFPMNLSPGKYSLGIALHSGESHAEGSYLWKDGVLQFELERLDVPKFEGAAWIPVKVETKKGDFSG